MTFDIEGARRAGYSDREIADHLAGERGFNVAGAREAGYSDADLVRYLGAMPAPASAQPGPAPSGFAMGMGDLVHGGAQLLANAIPSGVVDAVNAGARALNEAPVIGPVTRALGMTPATPQDLNQGVATREAEYQAARRAAGESGVDWGRLGGQVAASIPAALALPAVGSGILGAGLTGAFQGGILGAAQPVTNPNGDFWDEKGRQATQGAVAGGVVGPVAHVVGRAIAPNLTAQQTALREAGVPLTPGQIAGGFAQRLEEKAGSLPVVGEAIGRAQQRGIEGFNRAAANNALAPIGQRVARDAAVGRELVEDVGQRISAAYDRALVGIKPFGPDAAFAADLTRIGAGFLTPENAKAFAKALQDRVVSRLQASGGVLDGATYQTIKSELGSLAREYGSAVGNAGERELGRAFTAVQKSFQDLLARANPQARGALRSADEAYTRFLRVQAAAGKTGAVEGVFTPAQLGQAVREMDTSARHSAFARGDAPMQELSDAGRNVLSVRTPNSGTADRLLTATLGAGAATGAIPLPALLGGGAALGAYSRLGQAGINDLFAHSVGPVAQAVGNTVAGSGGALGVPLYRLAYPGP